MKSASGSPETFRRRQCLQAGSVLAVATIACLALIFRLGQTGNWLPDCPVSIGPWEAVTIPLGDETRNILGNPPLESLDYRNPLEDRVTVQVLIPRTFDAYREPPEMTQYFSVSAQRILPLFGPDKPVRAWIWKGRNSDKTKAMMFCWIQERSGNTRLFGLRGTQQSFLERLQISRDALLNNQDRCIIRLYTIIHTTDKTGAQARRNLEEVARGIYANVAKDKGGLP